MKKDEQRRRMKIHEEQEQTGQRHTMGPPSAGRGTSADGNL